VNIMLISQCSGHALPATRRILDQFAERRGDRTWQTPITQQGLETLRRLLRKSARRNTAVACHWIRGRNRSELIWIVGNAGRFNSEGAVPTNTTSRVILRGGDENDWHSVEIIRQLAKLAGLFHDLGKASVAFQKRLNGKKASNAYRHEWVSLRLFEAFVGDDRNDDSAWLARLAALAPEQQPDWLQQLQRDDQTPATAYPLNKLPPLAQSIGWLIVSHHSLPNCHEPKAARNWMKKLLKHIDVSWNSAGAAADDKQAGDCWNFKKGTPFASQTWCRKVRGIAKLMQGNLANLEQRHWLDDPYVAHLSRLCLVLSDHYYSSLPKMATTKGDKDFPLWANTDKDNGGGLRQQLVDHLIGVGDGAASIARHLPQITRQLPRIARHKGFSRRSADARFRWQDRAYDVAVAARPAAADNGFFGVNMASTGCGKTLANARIIYGLSDPQIGARFCVALGLRTLTLQTGEAYRQRLELGSDSLAVRVGGIGVKELFERGQAKPTAAAANPDHSNLYDQAGSASAEPLMDENSYVHYEGSLTDGALARWLKKTPEALKVISAPILVSTIDHLMPATEATRGGRQMPAMLRLLSSDLVLDEPDDFDINDLPALTRLVHWAGLLGSRVLLSSATLPPALVQGLFVAYLEGRAIYLANRGRPGQPLSVTCGWFDEHDAQSANHATAEEFAADHQQFVQKRLKKLKQQPVRRRARIEPIVELNDATTAQRWSATLLPLIAGSHAHNHETDSGSGKRVSVGLIRMANIGPLIKTAIELFQSEAPADHRIHLCCYHARHPLLIRSAIEQRLDHLLNRNDKKVLLDAPEINAIVAKYPEQNQIILVLATAVAEVGRDHDYDWAIVEPSSMRSIIQLAGRVRRHREVPWNADNILLLEQNWRSLQGGGGPVFCYPGFENKNWLLAKHSLNDLLLPEQYCEITAAPRIVERSDLDPTNNLVDLEHARLRALMLNSGPKDNQHMPVDLWWDTRAHLSNLLQKCQRFRQQSISQANYVLMPQEEEDGWDLLRVERDVEPTNQDNLEQISDAALLLSATIQPWHRVDYLEELAILAEEFDLSGARAAMRFGQVSLADDKQWQYHPVLGFTPKGRSVQS